MKALPYFFLFLIFTAKPGVAEVHRGTAVPMGQGLAWASVQEEKGKPQRISISFHESAISGLPMLDSEYVLPLPSAHAFAPFDHAVVNWIPHGHDPFDIYGKPHFDFHFYLIPNEMRDAIRCEGEDAAVCMKMPESRFVPSQYGPTPYGVPKMGWHWIDLLSPEMNGQPFTATMIFGYYDGMLSFLEPMITRDFLLTRPKFSAPIRQPEAYLKEGTYPQTYSIEFDEATREYHISLNVE
jgi:hypothetical protein